VSPDTKIEQNTHHCKINKGFTVGTQKSQEFETLPSCLFKNSKNQITDHCNIEEKNKGEGEH